MGARENEIGRARCPLCGGVASLRVSAKRLSYLAMDCCGAQLFTRSDASDALARALLIPGEPPPADPKPAKPAPAPAAAKPAPTPQPTPADPPAAPPAPAKRVMGWGLFPNV